MPLSSFPVILFQSLLFKCKTIHRVNLISSRDLFISFYQWDMNAFYMKGLDHSRPFVGYQRSSNKRKDCIYNLFQTNNLYLSLESIFIAKMQKNINRNLKPKAHSHGECFLHGRIELFIISCIHQWDIEDHQKREQSYICGLSI